MKQTLESFHISCHCAVGTVKIGEGGGAKNLAYYAIDLSADCTLADALRWLRSFAKDYRAFRIEWVRAWKCTDFFSVKNRCIVTSIPNKAQPDTTDTCSGCFSTSYLAQGESRKAFLRAYHTHKAWLLIVRAHEHVCVLHVQATDGKVTHHSFLPLGDFVRIFP